MAKKTSNSTETRNWRGIKQTAGRQAVSTIARKRKFIAHAKMCGVILIILLVAGGIAYSVHFFRSHESQIILAGRSDLVRRINFKSNGELDYQWFEHNVAWPQDKTIMEIDIFAIKQMLEKKGQIASAVVSRKFPDELHIEIIEREPVLRARVQSEKGEKKEVYVARDGTVYFHENYKKIKKKHLPYLGGVRFKRDDDHILSLPGMDVISQLLDTARLNYPNIFESWKVVSCEEFDGLNEFSDEIIKIRSSIVREIIFTPFDFNRQLDQLARVIKYSERNHIYNIKRIDLSISDQVAVQFYTDLGPKKFRN